MTASLPVLAPLPGARSDTVLCPSHPCILFGAAARQRDAELRARVLPASSALLYNEHVLQRICILESHWLFGKPLCLVGWEWPVVPGWLHRGVGDLLFTDGFGHFVVVEVKSIVTGNRNRKRNRVEEQAHCYKAHVCELLEPFGASVEAYVFTDDRKAPGLRHPVRGAPVRTPPSMA